MDPYFPPLRRYPSKQQTKLGFSIDALVNEIHARKSYRSISSTSVIASDPAGRK